MPGIFNYRGDDDFYSRSGDSSLVFSIGSHVEIYCSPRKRSRIHGPCVFSSFENRRPSIDVLPEGCLHEILRRLPGRERSTSACVSKHWLTVLGGIRSSELLNESKNDDMEIENKDAECDDGHLTRCIEGKKATDVRLAAIAIGTSSRGGLGKLSVRGSHSQRPVTDLGLSAIARGCPNLRVLSLWNAASISDEGLFEIARECGMIKKLDLCEMPSVSNKGVIAIAESSPHLTALTIESCANIGNESLQAIAKYCPNLQSVTIKDCPLVGDQGIASLLSSCSALTKVKLQTLNITDYSAAVIGHYGKGITSLVLYGLQNVSQKGFWVMGNARGLEKLSSLTITSCRGITDLSIEALGKGCQNLKHLVLRKCCFVSDNGFVAFAKASGSLESLQLEECNRITQIGVLNAISSSNSKLKSLSLIKCMGIKDLPMEYPTLPPCESIRSLSIRSCSGIGSTTLSMVGKLCPNLHHLDLSGVSAITDTGVIALLESCGSGLTKVNLSECSNLSDEVVFVISRLHGKTLELLNLDGCYMITDSSMVALADSCPLLNDLDISKCSVTDSGVFSLSCGVQSNLQILSLSGCSMISNISMPALEKMGKGLIGLNIQHCNAISNSAIESLSANLWRCDILS